MTREQPERWTPIGTKRIFAAFLIAAFTTAETLGFLPAELHQTPGEKLYAMGFASVLAAWGAKRMYDTEPIFRDHMNALLKS